MASEAQKNAVKNYRAKLKTEGLAMFSVIGSLKDKALLKDLAKRLSTNDNSALELRQLVKERLFNKSDKDQIGGLWRLLRDAPDGVQELNLTRDNPSLRDLDLS